MCIGIPAKVLAVENFVAKCETRNGIVSFNTMLVGEVCVGDWLMTFLQDAREIISAEQAQLINSALDSLEKVMSGKEDWQDGFADLINRENRLPPHLQHFDPKDK